MVNIGLMAGIAAHAVAGLTKMSEATESIKVSADELSGVLKEVEPAKRKGPAGYYTGYKPYRGKHWDRVEKAQERESVRLTRQMTTPSRKYRKLERKAQISTYARKQLEVFEGRVNMRHKSFEDIKITPRREKDFTGKAFAHLNTQVEEK